ncbi:hypothetical protein ACTD5D_40480 [Nocardia takedensis]|uniref:hypothetical protein n=1 Tax=Nocardia takedensis TaxID=259390 RepID=UPI003F772D65
MSAFGSMPVVVLATRQRIEVYSVGPLPCAESSGPPARASVLTSTEDSLRRMTAIAAGLQSQIVGDPLVIDQLARAGLRLRDTNPLKPVVAEVVALARRLRADHGLNTVRGYPSLAMDLLDTGTGPSGRGLVVLGAGALGREVARAGFDAGYERVLLMTRNPHRAHKTLRRTSPYVGAITVRDPRHPDTIGPARYDAVVATDFDHAYEPTITSLVHSPGCAGVVDLSALPLHRRCGPGYEHTDGPRMTTMIAAHNTRLARRAADCSAAVTDHFPPRETDCPTIAAAATTDAR